MMLVGYRPTYFRRNFIVVSHRLFWLLAVTLCLAGCAAKTKRNEPLAIQTQKLSKSPMDPELQKNSSAIYHYLVGELAYQDEDFERALTNFAKASELTSEPAPSLHSRLAELYVREGSLEKARIEIEKALEVNPESEQDLFLYAGILETTGKEDESSQIYLRLIKKDKNRLDAYLLLAGLYAKQERYNEGVAVLKRLARNPEYRTLAWYQIGGLLEQKGDLDGAARYYLKVYSGGSRGANAVADVIRVYLQAGRVDSARQFCRRVLARDPHNAIARRVQDSLNVDVENFTTAVAQLQGIKRHSRDANESHLKLALLEIEKQNYDEALRQLNLVLAVNPENSEARFYLASVYAATGRSKDAVTELKKIGTHDPMFVRARTFAAFVLMQSGALEDAEQVAREAWAIDKSNRKVFFYLISILRDEGKFVEAERLVSQVANEFPEDAELRFQHGVVLHDLKRESEALEKMEQVIRIDPGFSDALNYIAYNLAERGRDLSRALELVKRALESKPENAYYIDTLGWVYYQMGDYESAEKELGRAVQFSDKDAVILEHYGDTLQKRRKFDEARQVYNLIIEIFSSGKLTNGRAEEGKAAAERAKDKLERLNILESSPPAGVED
ncbi:MAG: tetratricopeptide repeat protein [Deltaproteobacteria bacterium]|nr:tetratricopeptide repeat protein [Deltaproteobacteria bacterium]